MKIRNLVLLTVYSLVVVVAVVMGLVAFRDMQEQTRGVTYGALNDPTGAFREPMGVNAALEQYSDAELRRALGLIRDGGVSAIRQHFHWNDIEPRPGEFEWSKWDRIVAQSAEYRLDLIAVLDTSPDWARDPGERDLPNARPARADDYARFVAAFVTRYGDRVRYVQLWDNPNVHPYWGRRNADPGEYTALLRAGATAARAVNPNVKIISAGLSPNREMIRGRPDYSDVLFLRGMYEAGAREDFDILGAKPYGMWTGPEDRRVAMDVFNFSRVILLREEMVARGDAAKPVWAVEFGWNALPQVWEGKPSPWGTDTDQAQSARLARAVQRARSEWAWMGAMFAQTFQPNAPSDDPVWGFALVDRDGQPRALYSALVDSTRAPVAPAAFDFMRFYLALGALALVGLVALWRGVIVARQMPWLDAWRAIEMRFAALPEVAQFALLALSVITFYISPNAFANFVFLALIVFLFALRLDLALAIAVFTIPFYLFPKNLVGSMQFSLIELLTLAAVAGWLLRQVTGHRSQVAGHRSQGRAWDLRLGTWDLRLETCDLAVLFFVLVGLLSLGVAANFGVANREFRVIVLEPTLLYGLIRAAGLDRRGLWRLVHAFILSALAISLIGLGQYFFTDYVIVGENVRRILAVYGSPNNLALYLDRALPLLAALVVFGAGRPRSQQRTAKPTSVGWTIVHEGGLGNGLRRPRSPRVLYALVALPIALAWFLTYSRAAWLGVGAGLFVIGLFSGKRVRLALAALILIGLVLLIPFIGTPRFQSLFQEGTGTGFFRVSVMQSGLAMIRDHPLFGVGLDNFLYEYPKYMQPDAWREPNLSHPHNIVLDFWARLGVLGVVALGWMVIEFYKKGIKQFRELGGTHGTLALGLMAGMTAALAHGMMDAAYFYVDLAFVWMLMLALVASLTSQVTGRRPAGGG
ncbi:MAG: O-antigen ligase family protein [Chloroflexi bacterium]|nr:O-antigen ligase family protein [Chloroflexota bacterium]